MKKLQVKDAAMLLNVGPQRVRQLTKEGRLPAERTVSGQRLYERKDVELLIKERAERAAKKKK